MIITEFVEVNTNPSNIKYFKELGYDTTQKTLTVPVSHLTKGSNTGILVKCDICDSEKMVIFAMQNTNIFIKTQKSGFQMKFHDNTKLNYRRTYEKDFLDYCFDNNISIEQGKRIKYSYDGKEHYYFSDFYYEPRNLIDYLFIIDKNYTEFEKLLNLSLSS